jgi:hypothetical protein
VSARSTSSKQIFLIKQNNNLPGRSGLPPVHRSETTLHQHQPHLLEDVRRPAGSPGSTPGTSGGGASSSSLTRIASVIRHPSEHGKLLSVVVVYSSPISSNHNAVIILSLYLYLVLINKYGQRPVHFQGHMQAHHAALCGGSHELVVQIPVDAVEARPVAVVT